MLNPHFFIRPLVFFPLLISILVALHFTAFQQDLISVHAWRQTETQTVIRNFYQEDFNILNPRKDSRGAGEGIHRKEFPIMQWVFAGVISLAAKPILVSRILSFCIAIFTLAGFYRLLSQLFKNRVVASAGTWALGFSPALYYYMVSPMPDNLALMSAIWGWACFIRFLNEKSKSAFAGAAFFLMLATLTKLPFLLFYGLPLYILVFHSKGFGISKGRIVYLFILALSLGPPAAWYAWVIPGWEGNPIVEGVLASEESFGQLADYFLFHLVSTLPELLLNYGSVLFFLAGIYVFFQQKLYRTPVVQGMGLTLVGAIAYFFFEINAIAKVHDYYLFPFIPIIFLTVSLALHRWLGQTLNRGRIGRKWRLMVMLILLLLPLLAYLRINHRWNSATPGFNEDLITYKNELRQAVPDDALVVSGSDLSGFISFYYIDKKGWNFSDELSLNQLQEWVQQGAQYLYIDEEALEDSSGLQPALDGKILEAGSISVFKLKPPDDFNAPSAP